MQVIVNKNFEYQRIQTNDIFKELPLYLEVPFDIKHVTLHWTGGATGNPSEHYHINVGDSYILASEEIATRWHYHCKGANSGNIGVSLMGGYGMTETNPGKYPITAQQIETAAKVFATLKHEYDLPWENLVDHAYFARKLGYRYATKENKGNIRWDCEYKMPSGKLMTEEVKSKAKWYYNKYIKKGS